MLCYTQFFYRQLDFSSEPGVASSRIGSIDLDHLLLISAICHMRSEVVQIDCPLDQVTWAWTRSLGAGEKYDVTQKKGRRRKMGWGMIKKKKKRKKTEIKVSRIIKDDQNSLMNCHLHCESLCIKSET